MLPGVPGFDKLGDGAPYRPGVFDNGGVPYEVYVFVGIGEGEGREDGMTSFSLLSLVLTSLSARASTLKAKAAVVHTPPVHSMEDAQTISLCQCPKVR